MICEKCEQEPSVERPPTLGCLNGDKRWFICAKCHAIMISVLLRDDAAEERQEERKDG